MVASFTNHFNRTLSLACLLIATSTFNYGFDNQGYVTTQAMTPFIRQFGVYSEAKGGYILESYWLSLFNGLVYLGFVAGVIIGSIISKRFGRRWCMFSMSAYALITATLAVTAKHRNQIMCARLFNYIYIGMELAVVPVYQSEVVPAAVRGMIVGTYQFSLAFGGLIVNSICRATSSLPDSRAYKIPFGLFYIVPAIVMSNILFCPESPRWLLLNNRTDEARAALIRLRKGTKTDEEIEAELQVTIESLKNEPEKGKYKELFHGTNIKRTAIVAGTNFFQQATGQAFASSYGTIFIRSLNSVNPFTMAVINGCIGLAVTMSVLFLSDRVGRRTLLIIGGTIQAAALITMGSLGVSVPVSDGRKTGIVAMLTIFMAGFCFGWAPLTYVVTTEVPALRLRDYSQRTASLVNVVTTFVVTLIIPYLMNDDYANLQSKVGFIFGASAVGATAFAYFCIPECRGLTLEQVDRCFQTGVPLNQFQQKGRVDLEQEYAEEVSKSADAKV